MMILFDLDGTLLPMDEDTFTGFYFKRLAQKLAPLGYEADALIAAIWKGVKAMSMNDGSRTNEEAFWACFEQIFGEKVFQDKPVFEDFYANDFQEASVVCGRNETAIALIHTLHKKGIRVALATNPIFPEIATMSRIGWAGLSPDDFELITTYETSVHSKPNPAYFLDVASALGVDPSDCIMIGNNAQEDMAAEKVGMKVFLLTDCLINRENLDISRFPQGSFEDLNDFLQSYLA